MTRARHDRNPSGSDHVQRALWVTADGLVVVAGALRAGHLVTAATATLGPFLTLAVVIVIAVAVDRLGGFRLIARWLVPDHAGPRQAARQRHGAVSARALWDLVPMFLAATAIRTLLAGGIQLRGHFLQQTSLGSLLAASVNNLPAAAALHTTSVGAAWAGVLAMAIGPNLVITGSVATVICRRLARELGGDLDPLRFTLVGLALTPLQLLAAFAGLHLAGTI